MASREDDRDGELRRRVARLEILATLAFLGSDRDIDEDTRDLLRRLLRDFGREKGRYWYPELDYLVEHLAFQSGRRSLEHIEEQVERLQGGQGELREEFQKNLTDFSRRLDIAARSIDSLERGQRALSTTTHEWLAAHSLGIDTSSIRLSRFVPLRAYLSDTPGSAVEDVSRAINNVLEAFGFELADEFPPILGSWFKKWFAKTKEIMTQPQVLERLEKLERAVDLKGLGQPQAEIDAKQAGAVAQLMKAITDVPNAAIQVGSILLIKLTAHDGASIRVRTLTQAELIHLENNHKLLESPDDLLARLSEICQADADKSGSIAFVQKPAGKKRARSARGEGHVTKLPPPDGSLQPRGTPDEYEGSPGAVDSGRTSENDKKQIPPRSAGDRDIR